jgi:hypothetical protein
MAATRDFLAKRATARADAQLLNEANYNNMLKQNSVTSWFESKEMQKSNPKEAERVADILQNDLQVASLELVKCRRERIRELYAAELKQYQDELAQKGLCLPSAGPGTE